MAEALHTQILLALRARVETRRDELNAKTGQGLEDREYQRHVGRIKECSVTLDNIDQFLKAGADAADDDEEHREQTIPRIARRT